MPAPDVLLPAAGAVLAAVTSSTPDAGCCGFNGYNGLMRRRQQNERRNQHGGDSKRSRNKKLDSAIR
jgi:hypothetical protein